MSLTALALTSVLASAAPAYPAVGLVQVRAIARWRSDDDAKRQ